MALVAYSTVELSRFSHAETQRAVFIHSAGQALEPGVQRPRHRPGGHPRPPRLRRDEGGADRALEQYRRAGGVWDIYLREEAARVGLEMSGERIARVTRDGKEAQGKRCSRARC